jgi:hypothetical protein
MTTTSAATTDVLSRILQEGYGAGAWHGPDLKAALTEVTDKTAFKRPAPGRHNIAEIALHHVWCVRSVTGKLTGTEPGKFILEGEDWFELSGERPTWPEIVALLDAEQKKLGKAVAKLSAGRAESPLSESERFDLVLGITCHAVYHAGQIQLVKRLLKA